MATYTDAEYIKKRTLAGHSGGKNTDVVFVDNDTTHQWWKQRETHYCLEYQDRYATLEAGKNAG